MLDLFKNARVRMGALLALLGASGVGLVLNQDSCTLDFPSTDEVEVVAPAEPVAPVEPAAPVVPAVPEAPVVVEPVAPVEPAVSETVVPPSDSLGQ